MRDQSANWNAGKVVEQRPYGPLYGAPHILEVDIDAVRACGGELCGKIGSAMIDARVEAEPVHDEAAFVSSARNPHGTASLDLGDPSDRRTDCASVAQSKT